MVELYAGDGIHRISDARCELKLHFITNQQKQHLKSMRGNQSLFSDDGLGYGNGIRLADYSHDSRITSVLIPHADLENLLDDHRQVADAYRRAGAELHPIEELIYGFIEVCRLEKYSLIVISLLEEIYGD